MASRLSSTIAKIERAKEHVRNLETEISTFWSPDRYTISREDDPDTGDEVFRIHGKDFDLPARWSCIIGEVVHNLRSALDHLAWQLVLANGQTPARTTEFPIFETSDKYESRVEGKIKGASDAAMRVAKSLKLYKGGNDIYLVHALNIIDKHRMLVTTGISRFAVSITGQYVKTDASGGREFIMRTGSPISVAAVPLEEGAEIYRIRADLRNVLGVDMNPKFTVDVALREPSVIEGKSLTPFLLQLADLVRQTIGVFYTNCPEIR